MCLDIRKLCRAGKPNQSKGWDDYELTNRTYCTMNLAKKHALRRGRDSPLYGKNTNLHVPCKPNVERQQKEDRVQSDVLA
jgi:hypothetical protein